MTSSVLGIADGRAFGGSLRVVVTRAEALAAARSAVERVITEIDAAASRFREDSELSLLNARPDRVTKVSPLLALAIAAALRGAELGGGVVDPTIGSAIRLAGYDADFDSVARVGPALRVVAHRIPGWQAIRFSAATRTVLIPRGVELDLGATAKALAADLAAVAALEAARGGGVLVDVGGDIAVAGEAPPGGWLVQISDDSAAPIVEGEETISISAGAIATSGTTVRRWVRGGTQLHHIINPANGLPARSCWRTVSVIAGTCVDANIASTASIVLGDEAPAWLERSSLTARLVHEDGSVTLTTRWPHAASSKPAPSIL